MLFNKANNGAAELKELTSSYYKNNKFDAITTQIEIEEEAMIKLVGQDLYDRALNHYQSASFRKQTGASALEKINDQLVDKLRRPIAYKATLRYYHLNLISHEDTGRKVKIDRDHEVLPWEWMVDRDDEAQNRLANETTDLLINWLEKKQITEWISSPNRAAVRDLFVNSAEIFHDAYPINLSSRFFYTVVPFIREVQTIRMKKALGAQYEPLLAYWKGLGIQDSGSGSAGGGIPSESNETFDELLPMIQRVIPLYVMQMASKRLSIQMMPDGVVQHFKSMFQGRDATTMPPEEMIRRYGVLMEGEATYILDDIKRIIQDLSPDTRDYLLIPENKVENKYFRT
jgi:hypothetical protein